MSRIAFRNFTGGEVTPTLSARYDLQKYGSFLSCCENFIPNIHGDIERRPGTRFIASLGGGAVLLPFQFNTESENNYVLIFQDGVIKVATADGIVDGVELENPYRMEDVYGLSYAQVGDVVYIAHKNYMLRKITRSGTAPNYQWDVSIVALNKSLPAPGKPTAKWHRGPKNSDSDELYTKNETSTLHYVVTAVDENGVESVASEVCGVKARYPTDWVQGDYVSLSWPPVPGAVEYNVYRESAGYYGFIGCTSDTSTEDSERVIGLKSGAVMATKVYFAGEQTRQIDHGAHREKREWPSPGSGFWVTVWVEGDLDHTTDLNVTANSQQPAFILDGHLFVWVTKKTKEYWYKPIVSQENGKFTGQYEVNNSKESEESFWAMVTLTDIKNPAGTYAAYQTGNLGKSKDMPLGNIGVYSLVPAYDGLGAVMFADQNFEPDTSMTPKEDWDPFADGNNPATVAFHQQRMVLGGTRDTPASFFMSRTGDYENFRKSRPLQDDDPVEYMLASGSIDEIKWVASFGDLLIGTSGAEYTAKSSGAAITTSDIQISVESYWGSAGIQPMIIGNSVMHCQRSGSHVRDLAYSWENDGYAGNDLSLLAPQLVESHAIKQWAFQQDPGSNIWAVRDDGVLLCLTYLREQKVYAWSRHSTQGRVLSVCCITGKDEDVLMLAVERESNGQKLVCLERLTQRFRDEDNIEDAFFMDCGVTVRNTEPAVEISGLAHLEGAEVVALGDGAIEEGHIVENGAITLRYPAKVVHVGLNYKSVLATMPVETDTQGGSTLGKRRAYGKCVLRVYRSVGGKYAASNAGDLFNVGLWQDRRFYDLPFLPERYGEPVQPFSGDLEVSLPSGQDNDTMIWVMQDRPMPFRLVSIAAEIDFGEM